MDIVDQCILNSVIVRILAEPTSTVSDPDPIILKDSDPSFFLNTVNPAGSDPYQVCFLRLETVYTVGSDPDTRFSYGSDLDPIFADHTPVFLNGRIRLIR